MKRLLQLFGIAALTCVAAGPLLSKIDYNRYNRGPRYLPIWEKTSIPKFLIHKHLTRGMGRYTIFNELSCESRATVLPAPRNSQFVIIELS